MNFTNIELLNRWNDNTQILQMKDNYTYIQFTNENSAKPKLKIDIDKDIANYLIDKLNLIPKVNSWFKDTVIWRKL